MIAPAVVISFPSAVEQLIDWRKVAQELQDSSVYVHFDEDGQYTKMFLYYPFGSALDHFDTLARIAKKLYDEYIAPVVRKYREARELAQVLEVVQAQRALETIESVWGDE